MTSSRRWSSRSNPPWGFRVLTADGRSVRARQVRAREVAFVRSACLDRAAIASRTERGQRRLAAHLDEDLLLDVVDDERLRAYLRASEADDSRESR